MAAPRNLFMDEYDVDELCNCCVLAFPAAVFVPEGAHLSVEGSKLVVTRVDGTVSLHQGSWQTRHRVYRLL